MHRLRCVLLLTASIATDAETAAAAQADGDAPAPDLVRDGRAVGGGHGPGGRARKAESLCQGCVF